MRYALLGFCFLFAASAAADDGLIRVISAHSVKVSIDRLEKIVTEKGFKVVARVNHAGAARSVGSELRDTELLIFGNPKVGSALMQAAQSIGIDLPVKVLGMQDAEGKVFLVYNDPVWMTARHGITEHPVIAKMSGALKAFTHAAAGK